MTKIILLGALYIFLTACAPQQLTKPNLDDSIYSSRYEKYKSKNLIGDFQIDNKARLLAEKQRDGSTNFSESRFPINVSEPTRITVQNDLQRYFDSTTLRSTDSNLKVFVTILVAESFKANKINGTAFIPLVGAFTGSDTKIGMNLKIRVEIERSGVLIKDWVFERRIDRVTSKVDSDEDDYKLLIADYRQIIFEELDVNILRIVANDGRMLKGNTQAAK